MSVLLLGAYPPPHGGVQTNLVALRRLLLTRQIPCSVVNLSRFRRANEDSVYYPRNPFEVVCFLLKLRYDIIHIHIGGRLSSRLLALILLCSLIPRKSVVLTFHSGGYPLTREGASARPRSFRGFVFRRLEGLIGVNPQIIQFFHKLGVAVHRTRLISPYAFLAGAIETPLPVFLQNFLDSRRPVIITVGGLEPEYDLPLQIDAMDRIRRSFPNAGLIIIGSGSQHSELESQIDAKPYRDHILLCGDVPHPVTLRAVAESDLFVRTTLYDGDSISVREALQLGVPVIATDNGMRPDGVRLVRPRDPDAFCRAIEEVLSGLAPRRLPSLEGHERNLELVLEFYSELASPGFKASLDSPSGLTGPRLRSFP